MKYIILSCIFFLSLQTTFAQELNCTVNINATQVTGDKQVFPNLQDAIRRYMNSTKWSNDAFSNEEKIECFIDISVQKPYIYITCQLSEENLKERQKL